MILLTNQGSYDQGPDSVLTNQSRAELGCHVEDLFARKPAVTFLEKDARDVFLSMT